MCPRGAYCVACNERWLAMAAVFNERTHAIECVCGSHIPLSRQTLRRPDKFAETMEMARELHKDCDGEQYQADLSRRWNEIVIRARHQGVTHVQVASR